MPGLSNFCENVGCACLEGHVGPQGPPGPPGHDGLRGVTGPPGPGLSNVYYVWGPWIEIEPGGRRTLEAVANDVDTDFVVSGGFNGHSGIELEGVSQPNSIYPGNGWQIAVINPTLETLGAQAFAVCATLTGVTHITQVGHPGP